MVFLVHFQGNPVNVDLHLLVSNVYKVVTQRVKIRGTKIHV